MTGYIPNAGVFYGFLKWFLTTEINLLVTHYFLLPVKWVELQISNAKIVAKKNHSIKFLASGTQITVFSWQRQKSLFIT